MSKSLRSIVCLVTLAILSGLGLRALCGQEPDAPRISPDAGKTVQDKFEDEGDGKENDFIRKRMQWFHDQRAYPHKTIPPGIRQAAIKTRDRKVALEAALRRAIATGAGSSGEPAWTLIGPQTVDFYGINAGRVTAIAIDPSNPQIVYMGGAEGGVWKTIDGGTAWTPLTDSQVSLAVGSIALDPSNPNTIYVGTGEENFSGDSYYGAGILKSTDAGQTWTQIAGSFAGGACGGDWIGAVAVHPTNSQIVLAGVESCYSSSSGIYRSTDGGQTWTPEGKTPTVDFAITTIVFDNTNGNLVYASTSGNGLYKSTDAGVTWNPANGSGSNTLPTSNLGRAALAIAPSSTSTLYVAVADEANSKLLGMYKTVDAGANWTPLPNAPDFCNGQCWYDIVLAVSPTNPEFVVAGGVYTYYSGGHGVVTSADGGSTWADQSAGLHPDTHALAFTPDGSTLFVGNDGGVWSTANPTASQIGWSDLNASLAITEFYPGISMDPSNVKHTYIGTQDNGTQKYTGSLNWNWVTCGDGGATAIDYQTPTNIYATCEELSMETSTDGGNSWNSAVNGFVTTDRTAWVPPMVMDPVHPKTLYFGTYRVYQTTNAAALWNPISGDLTTSSTYGALSTIAVAPTDPNTVYTGSSDAEVNVTRNALSTTAAVQWTDVTSSTSLPGRSITWIAVDPTIATTAYVGYSGFTGYGDKLGHIFKTTNAGSSWTDISSDLPNTPVDAILVDPDAPDTIFIGTDIGTFYTTTGGSSWSALGTGLPNVVVTGLGLHENSRTLRASTHGRSVWDLNIATLIPVPTINTVSPTSVNANGASFTLTVDGLQFNTNAVVVWNSSPLTTTYVNSGEVTATVPATDLLAGGKPAISVMNGVGGKLSNPATVTVENPAPTLVSLSQNSATAGRASLALTVTGSNFVSTSKIEWGGTALATTYRSETSLSATVSASQIAKAGSVSVTVANPTPGGGTSAALILTIDKATPSVTVTPSSGSVATTQALTVIVAVGGAAGSAVPTGSVKLTGGGYTSAAATLSGGNATITVPAGAMAIGTDTLTVTYTPDSSSSSTYNSATGSASVTVATAPPAITTQPVSQTVADGSTATFSVAATGTPTLTYQWQYLSGTTWKVFGAGTGASTAALTTVATTAAFNGLQFRVVVTDGNGLTTASTTATLTISPAINIQPVSQTVSDGSTATFTVGAAGVATLTYQWQYLSGTTWKTFGAGTGASTATLTTVGTTAAFNGLQFRVVVTGGNGLTVTSNSVTLTVRPAITTQPTSQTVAAGSTASFSAVAAGVPTLTYQWQYLSGTTWKAFGAGTGSTTAALTTVATTSAFNGLQFRVVVTDGNGLTATSNTATLTVQSSGS